MKSLTAWGAYSGRRRTEMSPPTVSMYAQYPTLCPSVNRGGLMKERKGTATGV
jgi:hypothetical protein